MVKFEIEDKGNYAEEKPKIKKGYYKGRFVEIVTSKGDGSPIETQFGHLGIMKFLVIKEDGEPMKYKDGEMWFDVVLNYYINIKYKDPKTGELKNGFTSKNKSTRVFECLGLNFDPKNPSFDTDEYIGKELEINVDDFTNKEGVKFSVIKEVNPLEVEDDNPTIEKGEMLSDEIQKKIASLTTLHNNGVISDKDYKEAIASIKKN